MEKPNPLESEAFRRWFESSPLRDADGRPMVLYHGTTADVAAFDLAAAGADGMLYAMPGIFATDDAELASDYAQQKLSREIGGAMRELQRHKSLHPGDYGEDYELRYQALQAEFARAKRSDSPVHGDGANVLPVYVSLQGPLVVDAGGRHFAEVIPDAVRQLAAGGHDGLIVENVIDHASEAVKRPAKIVMALDPGQIKSAIGNDGSYDFTNPDIRHSLAGVENFDQWFQGSKVSRRGRPVVMYHRTASDFEEFDTDRGDLGAHFGTAEQAENLLGGHLRDGERTIPVYLSIKNPLRLSDRGGFHADAVAPQLKRAGLIDGPTAKRLADVGANGRVTERREANREIKRILAEAGYDGIVYRNTTEGSGDSYIAFHPSQVVSAITSGPGAPAPAREMATHDSVRAAIAQLVRVSADELAEGVGTIVVATSEELQAASQAEVPAQRDAAFQAWFADSKVVDEVGKPLVAYHGTAGNFNVFVPSEHGEQKGGFFFAVYKEIADGFARWRHEAIGEEPVTIPVYLSIQNPKIIDAAEMMRDGEHSLDAEFKAVNDARREGYDGLLIRDVPDMDHVADQWVAFRPEQIKSALGNLGTFDPRNPDIRYSRISGGATGEDQEVDAPSVTDVYGDQIEVQGQWFHAERIFGRAASSYSVGDKVYELSAPKAAQDEAPDEVVPSDLFRESGANVSHTPEKIAEYADAMRAYGGWGGFPPIVGRVETVTAEDVRSYKEFEEKGWAHELGFSRPLTQSDVGRRYVHVENGHNRSYAANACGFDIPVYDLNVQEQGKDFIRYSLAAGAAGLDPRAQAFHDVGTNTTVFLADRIPAGKEASVFLHETVHRHGRQALPEGRWGALVDQVRAWAHAGAQSPEKAIHDAAAARVATAGVAGAVADEELFAYAVEEAVAMGIEPTAAAVQGSAEAWLQVVVESIQRVTDKLLGNDLQELGGQDLVDLAYALAQLDSPEHGVEVRRALDERLEPSRPIATAEQSRAYADAVAAGQRRQALRVLHAAAGIQLVDYSFDRGGAHDSPDPVNGAPMWDVSRGIYPEDLYQGRMREYGTYTRLDEDAFSSIRHADGRPNALVKVYRSVEKDGVSKIRPGDWVTPSRGYAKEHGQDNISGPYKIISKMVHARDLFTDGNSILEWGYHPQEFLPEFPRSDAAKARSLQERLDGLSGVAPEPQSLAQDGPVNDLGPAA